MPACDVWDVVRVPFPYTDRSTREHRPALVVARCPVEGSGALLWVLMVTSAENRGWTGDVPIRDLALAGLPAASLVRTEKIATVDERDVEPLGTLDEAGRRRVSALLAERLREAMTRRGAGR